jgi:hypothetical protein
VDYIGLPFNSPPPATFPAPLISAAPLSAAVPEPATLAFAALVLLGLSNFAGRYQGD